MRFQSAGPVPRKQGCVRSSMELGSILPQKSLSFASSPNPNISPNLAGNFSCSILKRYEGLTSSVTVGPGNEQITRPTAHCSINPSRPRAAAPGCDCATFPIRCTIGWVTSPSRMASRMCATTRAELLMPSPQASRCRRARRQGGRRTSGRAELRRCLHPPRGALVVRGAHRGANMVSQKGLSRNGYTDQLFFFRNKTH